MFAALAARITTAAPPPPPAPGLLQLDGVTNDLKKVAGVALIVLFIIFILAARKSNWGKAISMVGMTILGLVILAIAGLVSTDAGAQLGGKIIAAVFG